MNYISIFYTGPELTLAGYYGDYMLIPGKVTVESWMADILINHGYGLALKPEKGVESYERSNTKSNKKGRAGLRDSVKLILTCSNDMAYFTCMQSKESHISQNGRCVSGSIMIWPVLSWSIKLAIGSFFIVPCILIPSFLDLLSMAGSTFLIAFCITSFIAFNSFFRF